MPYKPIRGGTIYNRKLAALASHNRRIRQLIQKLVETGASREEIQQTLLAIALITTNADEIVADLSAFDEANPQPSA